MHAVKRRWFAFLLWWRLHRSGGQALIEFALVFPVLCALLLGTIEMGAFGARWIAWTRLAGTVADYAAADAASAIPTWFVTEATAAGCGAPAATFDTSGEPWRLTMTCHYSGFAVPGLQWLVTMEALA